VPNLGVIIRPHLAYIVVYLFTFLHSQDAINKSKQYSPLTKKVYSFSKLDFVTSEGEFNESICTLQIPDLAADSPPYIAIYYRRENSKWFTESLYRKRLRFSFKDGVIKLDRSNFWDWFEIEEIKIVVIY
tara:strand:+ start:387 stop:776 length:390 start_codon:yes stop_codon:yes gene_type:complete